ncbi:protein unc-1-like [Brevipalpus obovatus]|uniref:protein unc-1-like n=1 Tax=Brevipalpus obovatus TaxID=246614 RepID=UPI003D9FA016
MFSQDSTDSLFGETSFGPNYKSIFEYSSLPSSESELDKPPIRETYLQAFIRFSILILAILAILLTFPVSLWFSIKQIKPLERCIIYRLGRRLPLKGPGLVFVIPCVDIIDYIDLSTQDVIVCQNEQLLTNDGSLIEIISFKVEISISNAVRSSTHLQDSRFNVEQFIKLAFVNMVGSTHVEDLERKADLVVRVFIENCNRYINRWGWSATASEMPKIVVMNRAEPVNGVLKALKGYFGIGTDIPSNMSLPAHMTQANPDLTERGDGDLDEARLAQELQILIMNFPYLGMINQKTLNIMVCVDDHSKQMSFELEVNSKTIKKVENPMAKPEITVKAKTWKQLEEALRERNTSKVEIITNF